MCRFPLAKTRKPDARPQLQMCLRIVTGNYTKAIVARLVLSARTSCSPSPHRIGRRLGWEVVVPEHSDGLLRPRCNPIEPLWSREIIRADHARIERLDEPCRI